MEYKTLLLDLDDTLYDSNNGLWDAIRDRMTEYLHIKMQIPMQLIPEIRKKYFETYGTTLKGLKLHHNIDADDYLAYVHDLPLAKYIKPDHELRELLYSLPQRKYIFTNADAAHANRVLDVLNIRECINDIIDVREMDFACKSDPEGLKKAMEVASIHKPSQCVYLDDLTQNLYPAKKMGIYTILVGSTQPHPAANQSIKTIKDLPNQMPELWK